MLLTSPERYIAVFTLLPLILAGGTSPSASKFAAVGVTDAEIVVKLESN